MTDSLADLARAHARSRPERPAFHFAGRSTTFAELDAAANRVAAGLGSLGVDAGERVAFLGRNTLAQVELMFGAAKRGAVLVPVNWRLTATEVSRILGDCGARVLFVEPPFLDTARQSRTELPELSRLVEIGPEYEAWLAGRPAHDTGFSPDPDDVAVLVYTSGTTGRPKGAMLTHRNLLVHTEEHARAFGYDEHSVNLVAMPLFHIAGTYSILMAASVGAASAILPEVDIAAIRTAIPRYGVTHTFVVPAVIQALVEAPGAREVDWSSVRRLIYGSAPISQHLLTSAMRLIGCEFMQAYGLTESVSAGYLEPRFHHDADRPELLRSCGRIEPWIEHRVVDPDGTDVPPGALGELWLRSAKTMKGYWRDPEGTAMAITADGWLRTGDVVHLDDDGFVYLHDRAKDMIISGAENVYPAEIEGVLAGHPGVAGAAVIGVPDNRWGEVPLAVVVARPGAARREDALIEFCRRSLARFKCPSAVEFVDALPRNAAGKVLKKDLRARYWQGRDRQIN